MDAAGVTADEVWTQAGWYRALTLTERPPPPDAGEIVSSSPSMEGAWERQRAWRAQKPFDNPVLFAERLSLDSLTNDDLLALLAEPVESLRERLSGTPDWLTVLRSAFSKGTGAEELAAPLDELAVDHPLAGCLPALGPILAMGLAAVESRVDTLRKNASEVPFDNRMLSRAFLANIAPTLLFQITKPIVLELHIARLSGRLQGETPEARFDHFLRQLREGGIEQVLAKYPVLARQVALTVELWADYLGEFLADLCADWPAIRATFAAGGDPGRLATVEAGKGDRHRRNRSVLLVRFESGLRLLYKPKPLAVDVHFQELVSWLNEQGVRPGLRPLRLIDRGHYGWSEFVEASSCSSNAEVSRFYQRQGSYLAVLYALEATDLHNENLIAAGEHPVLVDLEALFHPRVQATGPAMDNLAVGALDRSVWQVGLLPRRVWSDEESPGVDMSGLGGQPGQMNPHRMVSWDRPGTDEMRLGRRRVELPTSENRPRLDDRDVEVLDYKDDILAGFTRTYRLLCRHREVLLREQLPRFADDEIRLVIRSTNVYGLLWYESFHPDLLRDALDRDRFFDQLWREAAQRPYLARIISAERRDLLRGDIPLFTTSPGSRTIRGSEGELIVDFLDTPSLHVVRQRVAQLGEHDLVKQRWIIEASLATLLMDREDRMPRPPHVPARGRSVEKEALLSLATGLGKRLDELALQDDTGAHWLGVGPLDGTRWALFPSGTDLYAGTSGIALFLAYLGAMTGEPAPTVLAHRASISLRRQVRAWVDTVDQQDVAVAALPVGAFEGVGSVIYVLTHLGALWKESDLLDDADELVERLPPLVARDDSLDVIYGSAGCLLSLLSLHAVRPSSKVLSAAVQCGDRLIATARSMQRGLGWTTLKDQAELAGFSHGAAGIAFSLLCLESLTGEERFREVAVGALEYERGLFAPELRNWADLRVFPSTKPGQDGPSATTPPAGSMVAWCHGAAGIGLGRLGALDQMDEATTREEIDVALETTRRLGFDMNHSLCHGALGNVELLLTAARLLGRPEDQAALDRATAHVVASVELNGPVTGVPLGVETPGFMTGLAGVGYELLRLAEPDRVPCVLLLAPPC